MFAFLRCFFGPRIYRLYRSGSNQGRDYEGNAMEHYSDSVVRTALFSLSMAWSLGLYSSPVLLSIMYRKGYFTTDGLYSLCRLSSTVGLVLFVSMLIRGIGRMMSSDYLTFITALDAYKQSKNRNLKEIIDMGPNPRLVGMKKPVGIFQVDISQAFSRYINLENSNWFFYSNKPRIWPIVFWKKSEIANYDFEFREWPIDFRWNETTMDISKPKLYIQKASSRRSTIDKFKGLPCGVLSYIAIHSFGRMMIYPGSVSLLNVILAPMLLKGRSKLVEDYDGERFKLLAKDGNEIDTLLVDRRGNANYPNGNLLVICCEGNSGFYEYGITLTPIEAGYSVLGWNHPGFGSSTGTPYPDQELNAMDVVIQFAVSKLGFHLSDVVIYAWSIGGFSATWAAMNYPDIKGLVLDATFDDLVALAVPRMPPSWKSLVVRTIRDYMDLNNAEQLNMYNGPVLLIRRTRDEIISTRPSRSVQTNRGNDLLVKLMQTRYPNLVDEETLWLLKDWVSGDKNHQAVLWTQQGVEEDLCAATLSSYIEENGFSFPLEMGDGLPADMKRQLLLYLADKYMLDFDSTHCVQLPSRLFQLPWDIKSIDSHNQIPKSHI